MSEVVEHAQSALTKIVVSDLVKGYQMEQVAERHGLTTFDVARTWQEYVSTRNQMSPTEQWVLALLRLESLLTHVQELAMSGNDPDNIENMLKLLDRIEALQGLNADRKSKAEEQLARLSAMQTQLVLQAMLALQNSFRGMIQEALEQKTIKAIKGQLLDNFDTAFVQIAQEALVSVAEEADES